MHIVDHTGKFSEAQLDELRCFVTNDLLCTATESLWLDVIRIRNDERADYFGYWSAEYSRDTQKDVQQPVKVSEIVAVIVLNYFYLKTLEKLKETLAHEYGHHWTLSYFLVNKGFDWSNQRIPKDYYQLRGLNSRDFSHDYSKGWHQCDREIIAEDYRILFAPEPYNKNHKVVEQSQKHTFSLQRNFFINFLKNFILRKKPILPPDERIKNYIMGLKNP
ncbi:hypothetical protein [Nostoc sp. UHCC 0252]|uniref:hypothetical protein n=1 Tax=Nostoc sp. UHCC 0252 TaxID=3110241 RepID=UPI002B1F3BE9|nr:hypothetical protein [Nostoc sp. UHCC 0252]MEA5605460.1 hypothetical protein [Nostoc sp. UHCC 0252]